MGPGQYDVAPETLVGSTVYDSNPYAEDVDEMMGADDVYGAADLMIQVMAENGDADAIAYLKQ